MSFNRHEELETAVDKLKLIPLTVHLANSCLVLFWGSMWKFYRNGACSISGSNNGFVVERDAKFWSNWACWYGSDWDNFFLINKHFLVFYDLFSEYQKRKLLSQGIYEWSYPKLSWKEYSSLIVQMNLFNCLLRDVYFHTMCKFPVYLLRFFLPLC